MNKQPKKDKALYEECEKSLAVMIFERSKGEIPEFMCERIAKTATKRIRYDESKGDKKSMEEYADDYIWAYFQ